MPPKVPPRRLQQDWSWVGDEAKSVDEITAGHRRRAAGLGPELSRAARRGCAFKYEQRGSRSQTVDSNVTDDSVVIVNDPCNAKKCKNSPRCYNHLGDKNWFDVDAHERFMEHRMGVDVEVRDGPPGLKNYGATCYANAFLQVWYHNTAFRNGVYAAVSDNINPLRHLANIFGMLESSQRSVVDPGELIEALGLAKGNQQDAAEFSKLFMSLLTAEFQRQGNKTFISDQFQGKLEYTVECQDCGYQSTSESSFLELDIPLKDKASLEDLLEVLMKPETMDGDNRWRCHRCDIPRRATRSTSVKELPPVLHFSLMRFVYNLKTLERLKSSAMISYPRELDLGGEKYDLRGIVSHEGRNATHGHFIAEVYNEEDHEWYQCNDQEVIKISDRPRKRPKMDATVDLSKSKDAYMLVYKKRGPAIAPLPVPDQLRASIDADNLAMEAEIADRAQKRLDAEEEFANLVAAKREVLACLRGDDCIVPRDALSEWIMADSFNTEWNFDPILCEHKKVSINDTLKVRLISRDAFDIISKSNALIDVDVCDECVADKFLTRSAMASHKEQVRAFDDLNGSENGFYLSAQWVKDWKSGKTDAPPTHPDYTLLCEHGRPTSNRSRKSVSSGSLAVLHSIFGNFDAIGGDVEDCDMCAADKEKDKAAAKSWASVIKPDKQVLTQLNQFLILNTTNYLVPRGFFDAWEAYMSKDGLKPILDIELCPHKLLDFDPQLDKANYLTEIGWNELCQLFSHNPADCVKVKFLASPEPGKKVAVGDVSVDTCEECRNKRLSDFDEIWIDLVLGKDAAPCAALTKNGRPSRLRGAVKQAQVKVTKTTTVKDIKLHALAVWKISPVSQTLFLKGRELKTEDTIESMGLVEGDHLNVIEVLEVDIDDDEGAGFGGTALVGRIACPTCTFENAAGATSCDMCDMQFSF